MFKGLSKKDVAAMLFLAIYAVVGFFALCCVASIVDGKFTSNFSTAFIVSILFLFIGSPVAIMAGNHIDNIK